MLRYGPIVLWILLCAWPAFAKPPHWAPAHGWRAKQVYIYYPAKQVYYAPNRGIYFWLENGRWLSNVTLPPWLVIDPRHGVSIELDTMRPYVEHTTIFRQYPPAP